MFAFFFCALLFTVDKWWWWWWLWLWWWWWWWWSFTTSNSALFRCSAAGRSSHTHRTGPSRFFCCCSIHLELPTCWHSTVRKHSHFQTPFENPSIQTHLVLLCCIKRLCIFGPKGAIQIRSSSYSSSFFFFFLLLLLLLYLPTPNPVMVSMAVHGVVKLPVAAQVTLNQPLGTVVVLAADPSVHIKVGSG